jgi:hypothetical protein
LVAGDFNGDGNLDLAVTTARGFSVLFGNGNGTFQNPARYITASQPYWIAAGDLNQDGHLDIVLAAPMGESSVYIYLNDSKGHFSAAPAVPLSASQVAIGDVNGDGIPDLVGSYGCISLGSIHSAADSMTEISHECHGAWKARHGDLEPAGALAMAHPNGGAAAHGWPASAPAQVPIYAASMHSIAHFTTAISYGRTTRLKRNRRLRHSIRYARKFNPGARGPAGRHSQC